MFSDVFPLTVFSKQELSIVRDAVVGDVIGDRRENLVDMAAKFLQFATETDLHFTKNHRPDIVRASTLYLSCRELDILLRLVDVSNHLGVTVNELGCVYLKLCKILHLVVDGNYEEHVDPSFVIPPDFFTDDEADESDDEAEEQADKNSPPPATAKEAVLRTLEKKVYTILFLFLLFLPSLKKSRTETVTEKNKEEFLDTPVMGGLEGPGGMGGLGGMGGMGGMGELEDSDDEEETARSVRRKLQ